MKRFFIFLLLPFFVIAQEGSEKNPAVELPEFVITGKDIINLQQTKKPETDLIPVVNNDFLKPEINPEELQLGDLSVPENIDMKLRDTVSYKTGMLKTLFGVYSIPGVTARITSPLSKGIFTGYLDGLNVRPFIKNSERYFLNAGAGLSLFSDYRSSFLPGTEYNFNVDLNSKSYKMFAGVDPTLKRNLYQGSLGASVKNIFSDKFLLSLQAGYKLSNMKAENFNEGLLSADAFTRYDFGNFNGGIYLKYNNQMFEDSTKSNAYYNFISIRPFAGFEITKLIKISAGLTYSHAGGSDITSLYASAGIRLNRYLTFYSEYAPGGEFITASELLDKNIYSDPQNSPNIFVKKTHDLQAALRFEYERYFEISGGVRYRKYNNLPYFSDMSPGGKFSVNTADAEMYGLFLNLLFHRGPYGYFYASAEAGEVTDEKNNPVPYFPSLISSLTYGYDFPIGLNAESNLVYRSAVYADAANTKKIDAYINLNINLTYSISENFKLIAGLNNLLDRKNFIWSNYREIPMDLSAGISYIW